MEMKTSGDGDWDDWPSKPPVEEEKLVAVVPLTWLEKLKGAFRKEPTLTFPKK